LAAWFIILAGVFDTLDGLMARITRSSSQFGVELDSLSDVVSFGAAPSFLVWKVHLYQLAEWGLIIAAFPLVFGAIRLARFNVQLVGFDKSHFTGMPIPMQAITVCAFLLQFAGENGALTGWPKDALAPLTVALGLLMVSRVKYDTLPKLSRKEMARHPWKIVSFAIAGLIVIFSKGEYLFGVLSVFILFGIVRAGVSKLRHQPEPEADDEPEPSSVDV
jgi:CDP-diacylglycerol--serine O-phosphatidyltransferase